MPATRADESFSLLPDDVCVCSGDRKRESRSRDMSVFSTRCIQTSKSPQKASKFSFLLGYNSSGKLCFCGPGLFFSFNFFFFNVGTFIYLFFIFLGTAL